MPPPLTNQPSSVCSLVLLLAEGGIKNPRRFAKRGFNKILPPGVAPSQDFGIFITQADAKNVPAIHVLSGFPPWEIDGNRSRKIASNPFLLHVFLENFFFARGNSAATASLSFFLKDLIKTTARGRNPPHIRRWATLCHTRAFFWFRSGMGSRP